MLVSSIGYFSPHSTSSKDYSNKNQNLRVKDQAGFGQVNEISIFQSKNIFKKITDSIISIFSNKKSEYHSKKSYIA